MTTFTHKYAIISNNQIILIIVRIFHDTSYFLLRSVVTAIIRIIGVYTQHLGSSKHMHTLLEGH